MRNSLFRYVRALPLATLLSLGMVPVWSQSSPPSSNPLAIDETVPPASDNYTLGPDSQTQPGVPRGNIISFSMTGSRIFPGTERKITVYVPAGYTAEKPACLYIGFDGLSFNAATVFDNLIAQHAMPVTIAIGVSPGQVPSAQSPENPRFNRSFEFDSMSDRLARFLQEEVIPEVERHKTADGRAIKLSADPNDRALGGGSTGAIAAFTVAWQRPDAFRRVFSSIGTYVGMRGGEQYYVLVRKTEPKPLRIFMQDGVHDEWPGGPEMGDWWMSNLTMNRALEFAGYDVRHVWGTGTHNGNQAAAVFPDAMRWLWRDWPAAIQAQPPGNPVLKDILQAGEGWQVVKNVCGAVDAMATDPAGHTFYAADGILRPLGTSKEKAANCDSLGNTRSFAFGPDGRLYIPQRGTGIRVTDPSGRRSAVIVGKGLRVKNLTVRNNGDIYIVTRTRDGLSELCLIHADGRAMRQDAGIKGATGLALSPDGLWLFVAQGLSRTGLGYRVLADGRLDAAQPFYDFYVPQTADDSGAGSVAMDRDGRAYVATRMGVQIFDRNGRVAAILPLPGHVTPTSLSFGGPDLATLYVAGGGKIYQRRLHATGFAPWASPVKLPPWGAG